MDSKVLTPERVVVAMSGGVDSSVTAALLVEQGYDVVGMSMRLYSTEAAQTATRGCCSPDDLYDARSVCERLGIPFYVSNDQDVFRERVIGYFVQEYLKGRTPNPCVLCNNHLKFDTLLGKAAAIQAQFLATGHYAQIDRGEQGYRLRRGIDPQKDQSYFLFGMPRETLSRVRFPIGGLTKVETRALAERFDLPTAQKVESQEICFVADGRYTKLVEELSPEGAIKPGRIVHLDGRVIGEHQGIHAFTIGQRRGLGLHHHETLFVLNIDAVSADVTVGPREALQVHGLRATQTNWLREALPATFEAEVMVRYRSRAVAAQVHLEGEGESFVVEFAQPQHAVTPGQAAVLYLGDEVLGGGWIEHVLR